MLPHSELPHARRARPSRGRGPRGCLRGASPAYSRQRRGAAGGLGGPPLHLPGARLGAQGIEGLPRRRSAAAGIPSLSPSVNRSLRLDRHCHSPTPASARKVQPSQAARSSRSAQPSQGGNGGRRRGGEKGSLAPPPGLLRFPHTHWAPPLLPRR